MSQANVKMWYDLTLCEYFVWSGVSCEKGSSCDIYFSLSDQRNKVTCILTYVWWKSVRFLIKEQILKLCCDTSWTINPT